jgi:5-methylcytosine-specific restriction protein A
MARLAMLQPRVPTLDTSLAPPPPKQTEAWYLTPEHKAWAAEVVRRAGGKCQDPEHVGRRDGQRCVADHIRERRDAPELALDLSNGMSRCWSCHTRKTNAERARRQRGEAGRG